MRFSSSTRRSLAVVDLNPAALRLTGLEKQEACAMRLDDLFFSTGRRRRGRGWPRRSTRQASFTRARGIFSSDRPGTPWRLTSASAGSTPSQSQSDWSWRATSATASGPRTPSGKSKLVTAALLTSTGVVVWETDRDRCDHPAQPSLRDDHGLETQRLDRPPLRRAGSPRRS